MIKKISTLGLLAATLIILPNAAFAGQGANQETNQEVTVVGSGSRSVQNANQVTIQRQDRFGSRNRKCGVDSQSQRSNQRIEQSAVVIDGGYSEQNADQRNIQRQLILGSKRCY